jgi:hypothetical protein
MAKIKTTNKNKAMKNNVFQFVELSAVGCVFSATG